MTAVTHQPRLSTFGNASQGPPMQMASTGPRPSYFLSRSNHCLVPLIPADELPFNIRLQGIPRVMTFDQTHGMQHVGTAPYTGQFFKVEDTTAMQRTTSQPATSLHSRSQSSNGTKQFLAPDHMLRQALGEPITPPPAQPPQTTAYTPLPQRPVSAATASTSWRRPTPETTDQTQAVIDAIVGSDPEAAARIGYVPKPSTTPPSGALPDQEKKEFCTYWIRTGECDYTQQGCLYKHEMPDRATLEKIGFRTIPRWWAEKNAVFKLGTETKATVGPLTKPDVWLKAKASKGSDGDDDSTLFGSDTESERSVVKAMKQAALSKPATTPALPPSPVQDVRKVSTTGSDLIDFAPLLPTPPSSTASSPRPDKPVTSILKPVERQPKKAEKDQGSFTRVFVPAGESLDQHIAEARKRASRTAITNTPKPRPATNKAAGFVPLEKQIQILQRVQRHNGGLMASRHAPPPSQASTAGAFVEHKRAKTGCRIRRPAAVSALVSKERVAEKA